MWLPIGVEATPLELKSFSRPSLPPFCAQRLFQPCDPLLQPDADVAAGGVHGTSRRQTAVSKIRKQARLRLPPEGYRELHLEVLERDGWRCQMCGTMNNLQVHHLQFRSRSGDDHKTNLITLCWSCHRRVHENPNSW